MNKMFVVVLVLGLLLISCVSAYICINPQEDNQEVKDFKSKINYLALKQDIYKNNLTEEGFVIKLKYFNPCKE